MQDCFCAIWNKKNKKIKVLPLNDFASMEILYVRWVIYFTVHVVAGFKKLATRYLHCKLFESACSVSTALLFSVFRMAFA